MEYSQRGNSSLRILHIIRASGSRGFIQPHTEIDGVISVEIRFVKHLDLSELWKSRSHIECVQGFLKAAALWVRVEFVCDGFIGNKRLSLVDEAESDAVREGPAKKIIVLGLHYHDEERNVSVPPVPVSIQIRPQAYPVAVGTGVERRAVERDRSPDPSLSGPPREIVDLPNVDSGARLDLQDLDLEIQFLQDILVSRHVPSGAVHGGVHLCDGSFVLLHICY